MPVWPLESGKVRYGQAKLHCPTASLGAHAGKPRTLPKGRPEHYQGTKAIKRSCFLLDACFAVLATQLLFREKNFSYR